jgi:hypothetical protein
MEEISILQYMYVFYKQLDTTIYLGTGQNLLGEWGHRRKQAIMRYMEIFHY